MLMFVCEAMDESPLLHLCWLVSPTWSRFYRGWYSDDQPAVIALLTLFVV